MAISFIYPKSYEVQAIQAEYMQPLMDADPIFKIFPLRNRNTAELRWSQDDTGYGLAQFRGMEGEEGKVQRIGRNVTVMETGVFGEYAQVTEKEITERARLDDVGDNLPIDATEIVTEIDQQLMQRSVARKRYNGWQALQGNLVLTKPGPNDSITEQVYSYPVQTYSALVPWATFATAKPIIDLQNVVQLAIGRSVDFGAGATMYMTSATANLALNNQNNADLNGRRTQFGATINDINGLNSYFVAQNLPRIVTIDDGYYKSKSAALTPGPTNFTKYIPDGKVIIVGKRPGNVPIGEYTLTRNIYRGYGDGAMGDYRFVKDSSVGLNTPVDVPANLSVHRGHNGGTSLFYSSAVIVMDVTV
jgi:hypothetical protein